jgi:TPR repeat protein
MRRQDIPLLALARQGDLAARCEVGRRYLLGVDGFPQHLGTGLEHLRQAARQDAGRAARVLAECMPLHDLLQAGERPMLERAAAHGSAIAQMRLAVVKFGLGGDDAEAGAGDAWIWLQRAAAGHAGAERVLDAAWAASRSQRLSAMLAAAAREDRIDAQAVALWAAMQSQAAGRFDALASALSAAVALHPADAPWPEDLAKGFVALLQGSDAARRSWPPVPADALRHALELRAAAGDQGAMSLLGRALAGLPAGGVPAAVFEGQHNVRKGAAWLLRAADAGDGEAWLHLYRLHADHRLSVANPQMARFFLEKAAQVGLAEAQRKLGALLLKGAADVAESEQAIAWLHAAAAQNDAHARALLRTLVLPVGGTDAEAAWALSMVQEHDVGLAARLALARAFGLTKLEALSVDPAEGLRPWGLVVGRNPFVVQARLSAPRAVPALDAAAQQVAERAATLFTQIPAGGDLRVRSLRQRRLFERLGLSEAVFFADASASVLDTLRLGPKWAHRTRAPLSLALAA